MFFYLNKYFELDYDSAKGQVRPIFLPKVHTATKLATQVRIPPPAPQASHFTDCGALERRERKKNIRYRGV